MPTLETSRFRRDGVGRSVLERGWEEGHRSRANGGDEGKQKVQVRRRAVIRATRNRECPRNRNSHGSASGVAATQAGLELQVANLSCSEMVSAPGVIPGPAAIANIAAGPVFCGSRYLFSTMISSKYLLKIGTYPLGGHSAGHGQPLLKFPNETVQGVKVLEHVEYVPSV